MTLAKHRQPTSPCFRASSTIPCNPNLELTFSSDQTFLNNHPCLALLNFQTMVLSRLFSL